MVFLEKSYSLAKTELPFLATLWWWYTYFRSNQSIKWPFSFSKRAMTILFEFIEKWRFFYQKMVYFWEKKQNKMSWPIFLCHLLVIHENYTKINKYYGFQGQNPKSCFLAKTEVFGYCMEVMYIFLIKPANNKHYPWAYQRGQWQFC